MTIYGVIGVPMAQLISYLMKKENLLKELDKMTISELDSCYVQAKTTFNPSKTSLNDQELEDWTNFSLDVLEEIQVYCERGNGNHLESKAIQCWKSISSKSTSHIRSIYKNLGTKKEDELEEYGMCLNLKEVPESSYLTKKKEMLEKLENSEHIPLSIKESNGNASSTSSSMVYVPQLSSPTHFYHPPLYLPNKIGKFKLIPLVLIKRLKRSTFPISTYAFHDLIALNERISSPTLQKFEEILYVTDAGQSSHFQSIFQLYFELKKESRNDERDSNHPRLIHVPFGQMRGEATQKKISSREGSKDEKLDEFLERGRKFGVEMVLNHNQENNKNLSTDEIEILKESGEIIGLNAIKYFDLSMKRSTSYNFSFSAALDLKSNSLPFILYSTTRISSILKKWDDNQHNLEDCPFEDQIKIICDAERELLYQISLFPVCIRQSSYQMHPHYLTSYLYNLSAAFHSFYEQCPILHSKTSPSTQLSRILMIKLTLRILKEGLKILTIPVIDKM